MYSSFANGLLRWAIVVLAGISIGILTLLGEMTEARGEQRVDRLFVVASVFVSLAVAGLVISYAFLRKPLGLGATADV